MRAKLTRSIHGEHPAHTRLTIDFATEDEQLLLFCILNTTFICEPMGALGCDVSPLTRCLRNEDHNEMFYQLHKLMVNHPAFRLSLPPRDGEDG